MRILFITNSLGFGGAEKMLTFVANSLCARGNAVSIANLNGVPEYVNAHRREIAKGIAIYEMEPGFSKTASAKIQFVLHAAKKETADVLIGFTETPNVIARIAGGLLGIPSIMSERGDPVQTGIGKGLKNRLVLALIKTSRGGVFQTEGAMRFYGKGLQRRGVVIPNPIFVDGEIPQVDCEERKKTVVSVGRLDNFQKRYDVMLDAFKMFSQKHPQYKLKLYGKGADEELIRSWVVERDLENKVEFMGLTTQPMQDIASEGMFLITSDFEGISNALLEAMAVGLPCVSTDHTPGGARLLIQNGENGLLAPVEDAVGLSEAMCRFADDPAFAQKCGERAKEVTARFAPDRIIDMWERYIQKICE